MRVLVTGHRGFIGSALFRALGNRVGEEVRASLGDLTQFPGVTDTFSDPHYTYIFHAADRCGGRAWSAAHPAEQMLENTRLTTNMLDAWAKWQPQARFVGFSSLWAYPGFIGGCPASEELYWHGDMSPDVEQYGITKKLLGVGIQAMRRQYDMKGTMLVLGNVYGPGDKSDRVIPSLIRRMRENPSRLNVSGHPEDARDFVFIDDQVEGILRHKDVDEPLLNVTSGRLTTIRELIDTLVELMGYKGAVLWDTVARSPQAQRIDVSLATSLTGWPGNYRMHTLLEGLKKTLDAMETK